jgi:hypothetical protein
MTGPDENSPEIKLDMALRSAFAGLDDLMVLACNSNTADLVEREKIAIGQIVTRAQLIASFLMARQTPAGKLRLIQNG